ncbi:MAG: ABC transporter permease subunit [Clostridia bacterium]|nr:ABC transporter permease subunit [Clostridia bacterium]
MKASSTQNNNKKILATAASVAFWLVVWEAASRIVAQQLFLASPIQVLQCLYGLLGTSDFYATVGFSLLRITVGFLSAAFLGSALAVLAYNTRFVETLLKPLMGAVMAAPVASFVVLALLLVGSINLSALVSFLMVLPVFYTNILTGLKCVEPERFEAAAVFGMLKSDRFRFIFLPYVTPFASSACQVGIGIAWKSGVSAEVIGIASGSIGEKIYESKLYLDTAQLFAYTLVVVALSLVFELLAKRLILWTEKKLTD